MSGELQKIWPDVPDSVVKAAKRKVCVDGVRGQIGTGATRPPESWLDLFDLDFLAEKLGCTIGQYDSREPKSSMSGHLPATKLTREPIILQYSASRRHWLKMKYLDGAPLPPVAMAAWSREKREEFLKSPIHAEIHAKHSFWALRRDPEGGGAAQSHAFLATIVSSWSAWQLDRCARSPVDRSAAARAV